jgi:hypothetical protein
MPSPQQVSSFTGAWPMVRKALSHLSAHLFTPP